MAVRIKLSGGREVLVDATLDELVKAIQAAHTTGAPLQIEQPDGRTIAITPQTVESMEEDPAEEATLRQRFAVGAH
jgi:hypothetical protein